jgi:hypothetical protein
MRTLQLLTAIGLVLFWTAFFTVGYANDAYPVCYETFEKCFPLPDSFITIVLLCAWWKGRSGGSARDLTRVAGGAMIFLGLCDISFNAMNGMYTISTAELLMNGFINVWCLGFGCFQAFISIKN